MESISTSRGHTRPAQGHRGGRTGTGAQLQAALGRHHAATRPDAVGFLYLDGHVRVYSGSRTLPKTHIARLRLAGPATEEPRVGAADGDPVLVLSAAPSPSPAPPLPRPLPAAGKGVGVPPSRRGKGVEGSYAPAPGCCSTDLLPQIGKSFAVPTIVMRPLGALLAPASA